MINRIKTHNLLNGILFSVLEFVFTALIIAPFAFYYTLHHMALYAIVTTGIIVNCLTIVAFGLQQYRNREKDLGIQHMFNRDVRERIGREHPHLGNDTSILVVTLLLPYVLFLWVLGELLFRKER